MNFISGLRSIVPLESERLSASMDRIARVADNIKDGSKVFANPSGTANRAAALTYGGALVASLLDPSMESTGALLRLPGHRPGTEIVH